MWKDSYFEFKLKMIEKHRIVSITNIIDLQLAEEIRDLLFYLDSKSEDVIKLYINSPGGLVYALLSILDVIDVLKSPVYTYVNGLAASAAAVLLIYGKKRFATKYSTIMFHQPLAHGISGQAEDIIREAKEIERLRDLLAEIVSNKTGLSKKKVLRDLFDRDTYLTPEQAKKLNVIDEII